MSLTVLVHGAGGRMGRFTCELLSEHDGVEAVVPVHRGEDLAAHCELAQIGFDFTLAGKGALHGRTMLAHGVRPVIGTSGVSVDEVEELDRLARESGLGGLVVPNFSLGMACVQKAAALFAQVFPRAEIVEEHHDRKFDAPSGTSLHTRDLLAAAGLEDVPIHSVRLPGRYAHQAIVFGGPGETVTLRHDMLGPEGFGPGILAALDYVRRAEGVGTGLQMALG